MMGIRRYIITSKKTIDTYALIITFIRNKKCERELPWGNPGPPNLSSSMRLPLTKTEAQSMIHLQGNPI